MSTEKHNYSDLCNCPDCSTIRRGWQEEAEEQAKAESEQYERRESEGDSEEGVRGTESEGEEMGATD